MSDKLTVEKLEMQVGVEGIAQTDEERQAEARLEQRLKWKIDLVILPLLALAYFLSSLVVVIPSASRCMSLTACSRDLT